MVGFSPSSEYHIPVATALALAFKCSIAHLANVLVELGSACLVNSEQEWYLYYYKVGTS